MRLGPGAARRVCACRLDDNEIDEELSTGVCAGTGSDGTDWRKMQRRFTWFLQ